MLTEKFHEVLKNEGVVTIVSWSAGEPQIVNTWNSYLTVTADEKLLIPAHGMTSTEKNVEQNHKVLLALGSKNVKGFNDYQGTGFVVEGTAEFLEAGEEYDVMKEKFPWLTRVLEITVLSATQKI